jgi:quaternary ammonium compound-resistance protein SugE
MGAGAYCLEVVKMEWLFLLLAGILEVTWAVFMKMSEGFTKLLPSVITAVGYIASAVFLAIALRKLPLGTAYAMWTGFGILGTTILGALLFKESISLPQAGCIIMIVVGIAGLKLLA